MHELQNRTLFIPELDHGGARVLAAAFRARGIDSRVVPPSGAYSNALGGRCTSGDECYPTKITLGDFLAILERGDVKPENAAFFMATADGPCRFGQYHPFMRSTLDKLGYKDVPIFSLTSSDAYHGMGNGFELNVWRGIVATDILRKWLHMTRPYEREAGATDGVYQDAVEEICKIIACHCERKRSNPQNSTVFGGLLRSLRSLSPLRHRRTGAMTRESQCDKIIGALKAARNRFNAVATYKKGSFPLIGVLGEIFCRLNTFSNQDLIRRFEENGAECWLVGVGEWILYTNADELRRLKERRLYFSKKLLKAVVKRFILKREEHKISKHFAKDLKGREECDVNRLLDLSLPYLPWHGCLGEMTLSAAGAVYFHKKGCAGVVDISSFACMNEIVAEAVFPKISKDLGNFPIKVFYFDGTSQNLDRDVEIFLELARNYGKRAQ